LSSPYPDQEKGSKIRPRLYSCSGQKKKRKKKRPPAPFWWFSFCKRPTGREEEKNLKGGCRFRGVGFGGQKKRERKKKKQKKKKKKNKEKVPYVRKEEKGGEPPSLPPTAHAQERDQGGSLVPGGEKKREEPGDTRRHFSHLSLLARGERKGSTSPATGAQEEKKSKRLF